MDSILPMLLAGGAGYLLSNLIGSKSSSGSAPSGSIGAFGVNQAALSPTNALNVPTTGTRAGLQSAWGSAGAPSAQSLGFNAPGAGTLGQLAGMSGQTPTNYNFQNTMQTPQQQLPIPQANVNGTPNSQFVNPALTAQATPSNTQQFQQAASATSAMPTQQPIAPMDINNVNFGATSVPGYTPPAGAPVAPNQINDFLKSLMG